jgi:hypothetical protein
MARPIKTGLDYFPLDVDFFSDDKIELISSEFGSKGEVIAIRLLCLIYRNGYYYQWGKDESLLFSKRVGNGVTGALVDEVVAGLVKRSFFSERVFNRFKILTSRGIQKRYLEAKDRAKVVEMFKELLLIDVDTVNKIDNVTITTINVNNNPQSKGKKSKEEESKGNGFANPFDENFLTLWAQWKEYRKTEHSFTYKSIQSEQAAVNELVKVSGGIQSEAEEIIRKSMASGWKGLFKLKKSDDGTTTQKQSTGSNVSSQSAFAKIDTLFSKTGS